GCRRNTHPDRQHPGTGRGRWRRHRRRITTPKEQGGATPRPASRPLAVASRLVHHEPGDLGPRWYRLAQVHGERAACAVGHRGAAPDIRPIWLQGTEKRVSAPGNETAPA